VTIRRASAPTDQVPVAFVGMALAPVGVYWKTPLPSGPVIVPDAPPPTAVGVNTDDNGAPVARPRY
jgi:hypothetical protein